ncbi:hypothetical protein, partial [Gluconobacter kanchanaburiensis]|uniref:hypothetical protein n=1 Tax=Gluconobacter kanchanaburiensis TaxID=563199 RepID=UPI0035E5E6EF
QSMKPSLCSKRRAKVTPETLNQSAKKLKSPDKRINQQFFDPSTSCSMTPLETRAPPDRRVPAP